MLKDDYIDSYVKYPMSRFIVFTVGVLLGHPFASGAFMADEYVTDIGERLMLSDTVLVLMLLVFGLTVFTRKICWPRYTLAGLFFVVSCLFSVLLSPNVVGGAGVIALEVGLKEVVIYAYLFAISIALYNMLLDRSTLNSFIWGLVLGGGSSIALACSIKFLHFPPFPQYGTHLQGTFRNGAQFGVYLFWISLALMPFYLFGSKGLQKKAILVLLLFIPAALFLSSKRSAMVGFGVIFVLMVLYIGFIRGKLGAALLVVLFGIFSYVIFFEMLLPKIMPGEFEYFVQRASAVKEATSAQRASGFFEESNKRAAFAMFKKKPLTGNGIGLVSFAPESTGYEIHNGYLKFLGEGGLFMIITGFWALYAFGMKGARYQIGQARQYLNAVNCYRWIYLAVFVMQYWGWGFRKREMWVVIAFIEAFKALYQPAEENMWQDYYATTEQQSDTSNKK